jgi:hypothetical protein
MRAAGRASIPALRIQPWTIRAYWRVDLKPGPDIPDLLSLEGAFLTDESAFGPGRLPFDYEKCGI